MRIAQVAPLYERVPPLYYGGTERIVSYLSEELVNQGHDVTLFATGDSLTAARLIAPCDRSLRLHGDCEDSLVYHYLQLEQLRRRAAFFDIVHFHLDYIHFPFVRQFRNPHITTLHGRLDLPYLIRLYREFRDAPVVSISNSQREPLPLINWQGTVYHGLPRDLYHAKKNPGEYLAFIGRISPEKRVDRAIEIAKRARMKLKIAAKIDRADRRYVETEIQELLDDPRVEFIGEIGEKEKENFLGNAYALLFPIDWPEPFGMVMIEAMACGTPTIAFRRGSVPEVIDNGISGFVVDDIKQSLTALEKIPRFDRERCRHTFEERFSATRMAADYVKLYGRCVEQKTRSKPSRRSVLAASANGDAGAHGTAYQAKPQTPE